jgi:hypothetical protein
MAKKSKKVKRAKHWTQLDKDSKIKKYIEEQLKKLAPKQAPGDKT